MPAEPTVMIMGCRCRTQPMLSHARGGTICEMNANPQKSLRKIGIERIQKKLREAKFFLSHDAICAFHCLDHEHVEFHLSAFLSAARSVTNFLEKDNQRWWCQWKKRQPEADRQLLDQMRKQRKNEVHKKGADVAHQLEDVPLSKIETASGLHAAYAPSFGEPWGEPQISLKVYYFTLGETTVNLIETCQRYVGLLERAVEEFSKAQAIARLRFPANTCIRQMRLCSPPWKA